MTAAPARRQRAVPGRTAPRAMFVDFAKTVYTLKEGTFVVDPRYKVLSSIGRGAQGLICAARDTCAPEPTGVPVKKFRARST